MYIFSNLTIRLSAIFLLMGFVNLNTSAQNEKEYYSKEATREELIRVSTWIDSNAQYYGTYFGKKNLKYKEDEDFRPVPTVSSALAE